MTASEKLAKRVRDLVRLLGSDNAGEYEAARTKLHEILRKQKKSWNDLVELMQTGDASSWSAQDDTAPGSPPPAAGKIDALSLVHDLLETYVAMADHERIATALWIAHAHVYSKFMISPRLALTSPVRGCGKTTLLKIIERMTPRSRRMDGVSAAAIYRLVDREHPTLLVDEADNLGLFTDGPMRATFNSGHAKGGRIVRAFGDGIREWSTFAPMAIAAIGFLPLPISHRSLTIHMTRYGGAEPLRRFDDSDVEDLAFTYTQLVDWSYAAKLASDPKLPDVLRNRQADNWRPLLSIADAFGHEWGKRAREAALVFAGGYSDEDISVILLRDIQALFNARGVDRITSAALAAALCEMDAAPWAEWRGVDGTSAPCRLSQGALAALLAPFGIRPRSIWPARRHDHGGSSRKGYAREQFERAWAAYCSEAGTAAQPGRRLRLAQ